MQTNCFEECVVKNLIFCGLFSISCTAYAAPSLMLAEEYCNQHVENWAASEKLDGVRAYWDGKKLLSRQGYAFTPPPGFTKNFPDYPLDGELYAGRGRFEQTSAAVRSASGDWSGIRLHVFDVPQAQGNLYKRLAVIEDRLKKYPANISVVRQMPVKDIAQARAMMEKIVAGGGEGVILRDPAVPYAAGRSSSYLKLKPQQDAECTVTKHYEGKGKYAGKLGSVGCRNNLGEFKIGSGFKDADRANPPPVGSVITYRYRGFTQKGLPRFATFMRIRKD